MPTHANKSYGWIKREGKLGGPGYTKKTTAARHRILAGVVKKYGYRSALGSIMALERSTQISATVRKVLVADRNWLRETYGAASKKALTAAKKTAAKKRAKKTPPRRVPSVARRSRKVRAATARVPRSTWSAARGSSYPTRKPGESSQAFARRINAWTLGGVKDATRRHTAKYPGFAAWMKKQPKQRAGYTRLGEYVDLNTGGSILTPGDYRDKYAREVMGEPYARYNPAIRDGFTRVDTVMVRHKPFMDIYRGPPIPKHRGMYPYYGVVRSTGEVTKTMRVRAALGPVELLGTAEVMAENAGLLKRPEKERGTRKRRSRMPAGVSADVYLESQATALFDRKMPEYEDPGKYYFSNPRLPMGATKYMSVYAAVPTLAHDSIKQQRQKVADIYRSRKGGYFVIYTVGSLPHTIVDNEDGTLKSMKDEVVAYITGTTDILQAKGKNDYRALRFVLAKGEKTPDLKLMLNGRSECGYHGVPTIRGECVVCAYEADVR